MKNTFHQRVQTIADIWGKLLLFHPRMTEKEFPRHDLFFRILAETKEELSSLQWLENLNKYLLAPFEDPFTFAQASLPTNEKIKKVPLEATQLNEKTGYIAVHPYHGKKSSFLTDFAHCLTQLEKITELIIDLRWDSPLVPPPVLSSLFSFFTRDELYLNISYRSHYGWSEDSKDSIYRQRWESHCQLQIPPLDSLHYKLKRSYTLPEAFSLVDKSITVLVNNASILPLQKSLAAIQALDNINVVWEQRGSFGIPPSEKFIYPEGIEVHIKSYLVEETFLASPVPISLEDLPLLKEQLSVASPRASNAPTKIKISLPQNSLENYEERIFSLSKVWILSKYFFFDSSRTQEKFDEQFIRCLEKLKRESSQDSYRLIIQELLAHLEDSHTAIAPYQTTLLDNYAFLPVKLRLVEKQIVVEYSETSLLEIGDVLLSMNEQNIEELELYWKPYLSASTPQAFYAELCRNLSMGKKGTFLNLTIQRNLSKKKISLLYSLPNTPEKPSSEPLIFLPNPAWKYIQKVGNNIAYIKLCQISSPSLFSQVFTIAQKMSGVILEMRDYPRAFQDAFIGYLCPQTCPSAEFKFPVFRGSDIQKKFWEFIQYHIEPRELQITQPLAVLIDESTVSAAEDVCIYLHNAQRATFVGSKTTGVDGNVTRIYLGKGNFIHITGMAVRYSEGEIQNVGIRPDIEVKPTIKGMREGRDEVLERAIEFLEES